MKSSETKTQVPAVIGGTKTDLIAYCGDIDSGGLEMMANTIKRHRSCKKLTLILITPGGCCDAAFRIGRLIQNSYQNFDLYIPWICKSAGTILAFAAERILMTTRSELGPIDAQVPKRNQLGDFSSCLSLRAALSTVGSATIDLFERSLKRLAVTSGEGLDLQAAAATSANLATSLMGNLVSRIDPEELGKHQRFLELGVFYSELLDFQYGGAKEGAAHELAYSYPDHEFVIDRLVASEHFNNLDAPPRDLEHIVSRLHLVEDSMSGNLIVRALHPQVAIQQHRKLEA